MEATFHFLFYFFLCLFCFIFNPRLLLFHFLPFSYLLMKIRGNLKEKQKKIIYVNSIIISLALIATFLNKFQDLWMKSQNVPNKIFLVFNTIIKMRIIIMFLLYYINSINITDLCSKWHLITNANNKWMSFVRLIFHLVLKVLKNISKITKMQNQNMWKNIDNMN